MIALNNKVSPNTLVVWTLDFIINEATGFTYEFRKEEMCISADVSVNRRIGYILVVVIAATVMRQVG